MTEIHRDRLWLCIILGTALFLRLLLLNTHVCIETEGVRFVGMARSWRNGNGIFDPVFPPLYPFLIAMALHLLSPPELAARFVSLISGTLVIFLIYHVARDVFGRIAGFYSAILAAVHPMLSSYATAALSESVYVLLVLLAFFVGLRALYNSRLVYCVLVGLLLGLSFLTRPEASVYLPVLGGALIWSVHRRWPSGWRQCVTGHTAALMAAFLLVTSTYIIYLAKLAGRADHLPISVLSISLSLAKRYVINLHRVHLYTLYGLFPPLLLFALVAGLFSLRKTPSVLLLIGALLPLVVIPALREEMDVRAFLMAVPVGIVLAARGLMDLQGRLRLPLCGVSRFLLPILVIGIVVCEMLPYSFQPFVRPDRNRIYRQAGEWLASATSTPGRVISREPWVAYYAGATRLDLTVESLDGVLSRGRRDRATHLIVDNRVNSSASTEMLCLLNPKLAPPPLRLLHRIKDPFYESEVLIYGFDEGL